MDLTVLIPADPEKQHEMKIALLAMFVEFFDAQAEAGHVLVFQCDTREVPVHVALQTPAYNGKRGEA